MVEHLVSTQNVAGSNPVSRFSKMSPKIIITGTGRAGTSLLVKLLTYCGLDTGFDIADNYEIKVQQRLQAFGTDFDEKCRAGHELYFPPSMNRGDISKLPKVLKSPYASYQLESLLTQGKINIELILIPIREMRAATKSRVRNGYGRGGQWLYTGEINEEKQYAALCSVFSRLMYTVVRWDIPHVLMEYPRLATNYEYCYSKLSSIMGDMSLEDFREIHSSISHPIIRSDE